MERERLERRNSSRSHIGRRRRRPGPVINRWPDRAVRTALRRLSGDRLADVAARDVDPDDLLATTRDLFAGCPVPEADLGFLHLGGALNEHAGDDGRSGTGTPASRSA